MTLFAFSERKATDQYPKVISYDFHRPLTSR
jgi:hypothetical protein